MEIGIWTGIQSKYDYEEYFSRIKKAGYDGVVYGLSSAWLKVDPVFAKPYTEWVKYFTKAADSLKNNELKPYSTHAVIPTNFDGAERLTDVTLDQFKKEIEATAILGCKYIVIHPINIAVMDRDKQRDFEINMEAFARFEPILKEFDVKLGVENMFGWDEHRRILCQTGCSSAEDMIRYIDSMNSDRFVACLDTGHMVINGYSPALAAKKLGNRLKLLHVHDNYCAVDNHNIPGFGVTDWHAFSAALKEINYDGAFTLEVGFDSAWKISENIAWKSIEYAYQVSREIVNL